MMDSRLFRNMYSTLSNKSEKQCISLVFNIRINLQALTECKQTGLYPSKSTFYCISAVVKQHINQLYYYSWLHLATCFGRYPAIIRSTWNSVVKVHLKKNTFLASKSHLHDRVANPAILRGPSRIENSTIISTVSPPVSVWYFPSAAVNKTSYLCAVSTL